VTTLSGSDNRDVVPRWRSVRKTVEAKEFQTLAVPQALGPSQRAYLERAERRWQADRTVQAAVELVSTSAIAGEAGEQSIAAAEFVRANTDNPTLNTLVGGADLPPWQIGHIGVDDSQEAKDAVTSSRIALQRRQLRNDPRNALGWAELARWYTVFGQFEQAERALTVALGLAPHSRYLLRSAARFFAHIGEPERAYRLLTRSPRTDGDPWLTAALLSVASIGRLPIRSLRPARRICEDENFAPLERSELVSEVATLDLRSGADRKARSQFRSSLETPTDNSLAQAEWASHRIANLSVELDEFAVPFADEAQARSAAQRGQWSDAMNHSLAWLGDQPFDTRAAVLGSYVATIGLEDFSTAIAMAKLGLRSRPGDPGLSNNLAFALLQTDQVSEAAEVLQSVERAGLDLHGRATIAATAGLLAYKIGEPATGRRYYEAAIRLSRRLATSEEHTIARAMYVLAEMEYGGGLVDDAEVREVTRLAETSSHLGAKACVDRMVRVVANPTSLGEVTISATPTLLPAFDDLIVDVEGAGQIEAPHK